MLWGLTNNKTHALYILRNCIHSYYSSNAIYQYKGKHLQNTRTCLGACLMLCWRVMGNMGYIRNAMLSVLTGRCRWSPYSNFSLTWNIFRILVWIVWIIRMVWQTTCIAPDIWSSIGLTGTFVICNISKKVLLESRKKMCITKKNTGGLNHKIEILSGR